MGSGFRRITIFSNDVATVTDSHVRADCEGDRLLVVAADKFEEREMGVVSEFAVCKCALTDLPPHDNFSAFFFIFFIFYFLFCN